jgi:hypothetical protein
VAHGRENEMISRDCMETPFSTATLRHSSVMYQSSLFRHLPLHSNPLVPRKPLPDLKFPRLDKHRLRDGEVALVVLLWDLHLHHISRFFFLLPSHPQHLSSTLAAIRYLRSSTTLHSDSNSPPTSIPPASQHYDRFRKIDIPVPRPRRRRRVSWLL